MVLHYLTKSLRREDPVLRRLAEQVAAETEEKPYEHWIAQDYSITYECTFEGRNLQVEINDLEIEPDYVHLIISVDDGGWSAYYPISTSVIVRREAT